jgi:hypothetical protein
VDFFALPWQLYLVSVRYILHVAKTSRSIDESQRAPGLGAAIDCQNDFIKTFIDEMAESQRHTVIGLLQERREKELILKIS